MTKNLTPFLLAAAFLFPCGHVSAQGTKGIIKSLLPDPVEKAKKALETQLSELEKQTKEMTKNPDSVGSSSFQKEIDKTEKAIGTTKKAIQAAGKTGKVDGKALAQVSSLTLRAEGEVKKAKKALDAKKNRPVPRIRNFSER